MRKLFGTDGIRGIANQHPMTIELSMKMGKAIASIFQNNGKKHRKILIGKDTRISGYMFESAMLAGICSMGVDVLLVGPIPTPAIAFLTTSMRAEAGIVISASHNPFYDNGIKIFSDDGFKLPDEVEMKIEELIERDEFQKEQPTGKELGKAFRIDDASGRYIVFLKQSFPNNMKLDGLKIVIDCANGATYKVAPLVFEELGAEVIKIGVNPDGININLDCGALSTDTLKNKVIETNANLGVAFDGDGDRAIFVDEKGNVVDGDHIMAICCNDLIKNNKLNYNTLVTTVMSNMGLEILLQAMGARLIRTQVGDRYVVEAMRSGGYNFGGEQSGHLIFLNHNTTGDGILAALQVLAIVIKTGKNLSELAKIMISFPQILKNIPMKVKVNPVDIPGLDELQKKMVKDLNGKGRILIRPSGTEALMRVMVEGEDKTKISEIASEIGFFLEKNNFA